MRARYEIFADQIIKQPVNWKVIHGENSGRLFIQLKETTRPVFQAELRVMRVNHAIK